MKNVVKLEIIVIIQRNYKGAAHSIGNLKCCVPKKITIVFHNGCNYDYHFIIKELAENLKKNLFAYNKTLKNIQLVQFQ